MDRQAIGAKEKEASCSCDLVKEIKRPTGARTGSPMTLKVRAEESGKLVRVSQPHDAINNPFVIG